MHLQSRIVVTWLLCFLSFILSLLILTAGTKAGYLEGAAIVFIQDLQNAQYQNIFQPIFGVDISGNPLVNTNAEWAEIFYLSICLGDYSPNTGAKLNTTCFHSPTPEQVFNLQRAFIPWVIGVAFTGFDLVVLLLFCGGRRHWNGWMEFLLFIPLVTLIIGGALSTVFSFTEYDGAKGGSLFVPLTWTSVVALFMAKVVHAFEYGLQKWTPSGERIESRHKPAKVPWVSYGTSYHWANPR